ncbi:MAG: DUF1080 domain-containing protein, partial [Planctomycetes bacterium]|nr:DUF1080 domain-containing protein [Planctomycetota bacterium]
SRQLVKCKGGVFSVLAEDSVPYVTGKSYQVKIAAQGSLLQISIDGSPVFSVTDSTFSSGTIALYSWGNAGSYFDDILVEGLSGANQAPVVSVTASPSTIEDTQTSQLQVTASDPDGPNALTYSWTVPSGQGSLDNLYIANPIYTPPDVSSTQIFTLTVKVSDGAAITTKTVDITVTDTFAGPQILLSDDFTDGNYTGWSLVDQGTLAGPMAWSAASGTMVQSSNVHSSISIDPVAKLGTYAYWQAGTGWTDYTAAVTIKSTDNDAIGVMFRYQDENNYYRFIWDKERNSRQLVKCKGGVFSILAEDSVPYVTGKSYQVKIAAQGDSLNVSIDGSPVFSVTDSTFSSGTIALYSWGNAGSYFDDILVEGSGTTPPAVPNTYSIEAFQFSQPQLADWTGPDPVGDRADTIAQIGNEQTWFCFDISEIPDSEQIISTTFTVRMRDYVDNATTQRTLWYEPDDSWAFSWPHDPDYYTPKEVTELVSVINFNHDGWTWITTDVDITQHDWSKDVLDNYVTFMLTGPLNGYYVFGDAGFDGAVLVVETL